MNARVKPPVEPASNDTTRRLDLGLVTDALRHRWKIVVAMMIFVPLAGMLARQVIRPKVKNSAQILVQESVKVNPFLKDMMVEWSVKSRLPLITSIVRSRQTLERVLTDMGEVDASDTTDTIEQKVNDFRTKIDVYGEGGGLIRISVVGRESERVFQGLTLLTDAVVEEMLRPQKEALDESVTFLKVQLDRISSELRNIEESVKEFKRNNAGELPEVHKLNLDSHLRLTNQIVDTETALVAAQQRRRMAEQRLLRYDPKSKKLRADLAEAKKRLVGLQKTYTNAHPKVRGARRQIEKLQTEIESRTNKSVSLDIEALEKVAPEPQVGVQVTRGSETGSRDPGKTPSATSTTTDIVIRADDVLTSDLLQYQASSSEVESLKHKLSLLRKRSASSLESVRSFAANEQTLNRLLRDQTAKSKVYTNLLERYEDALVTRELTRNDESKQVWVVEKPTAPTKAKRINILFVILGGPLVGLILGVLLVFFLEFFDDSVRRESDAVAKLGVPVLGTLPWLGDQS